MRITLDIFDLKSMLIDAAQLGAQQAERERNMTYDMMTERMAYKFMQDRGLRPVMLERFVEDGLVKPKRKGPAKNSPKMYSMLEIQAAIAARKALLSLINN